MYVGTPSDWGTESPLARRIREYLEDVFTDLNMGLDFRCINDQHNEEFRIQIRGFDGFPMASCFKAHLILYYYLHTPPDEWDDQEGSAAYSTAVFSNNVETGVLLDEVSRRIKGDENAIEKFNRFLRETIGTAGGLYTWSWPDNPTAGLTDPRYGSQWVRVHDQVYTIDNVFTPADVARCYDILGRGAAFTRSDKMRAAILATRALLSIPAPDYQSPIERVWPDGYMGKDGILGSADIKTGYVVDDGGIIQVEGRSYLIAFMSAGENEPTAISTLSEVVQQISVYEQGV